MSNNIVLIGFMGSGKSSIGRELAKIKQSVLIDIDALIESNLGMCISDIFAYFGEEYFRKYERFLCSFIKNNIKNSIIATGGGTPAIYNVKELGIVVYLDTPFKKAISRIKYSNNRPKLKDNIKSLYESRLNIYKNSSNIVIESSDTVEGIARKIINILEK